MASLLFDCFLFNNLYFANLSFKIDKKFVFPRFLASRTYGDELLFEHFIYIYIYYCYIVMWVYKGK